MIQIRKNTFETNSSSTHAFAYYKEQKQKIDFENYEATIEVLDKDYPLTYPIHTFESIDDKLRYFYTIFVQEWNPEEESWYRNYAVKNFMDKIFEIFPRVTFVPFKGDRWNDMIYMEDSDCVFNTDCHWKDRIHDLLDNDDKLKKFFTDGVIYFGDRDAGNPYTFWSPWDDMWEDNPNIEKITYATG